MKSRQTRPKAKKPYLKKIRKKNHNSKSIFISIVLAIAVFLSPVLYECTQNNSSFPKEVQSYLNNLKNGVSEFLTEALDYLTKDESKTLDGLTVHYIDVDQGDAELIQVNGKNLLIDTGESDQSDHLIDYLKDLKIEKLDAFIVTHPHTDHMGGATKVLDEFDVDKIYMTNYVHTTKAYENLLQKIKEKGLKITRAKKGVTLDMGDNVEAVILSPDKDYTDINASSVVLRLVYGDTSFLFTGDATIETEGDILKNYQSVTSNELNVDVYKVAHHGSVTSNSAKFLKAIDPALSIISAGQDNSYGHPHKEVVDRLNRLNSKILVTAEEGTVKVHSNGIDITYESQKGTKGKLY